MRVAEFYLLPTCSSVPARPELLGGGGDDATLRIVGGESRLPVGTDAVGGARAEDVGATHDTQGEVRLYDESSDSFVVIGYSKLLEQCRRFITRANTAASRRQPEDPLSVVRIPDTIEAVLLLRPNIEHQMMGIIMGTGGSIDTLGATLWGQTELSCFDDGQHGVWG